jgi:hypothetical protein
LVLLQDYSQNFIFLVFLARPLLHSDFISVLFPFSRMQTTARPGLLPDVVVPPRGVGPLLPEVAAIPADVGDLHSDVWNLLRDPNLFKEFLSLIWRVFSLCWSR